MGLLKFTYEFLTVSIKLFNSFLIEFQMKPPDDFEDGPVNLFGRIRGYRVFVLKCLNRDVCVTLGCKGTSQSFVSKYWE